MVLTSTAIRGNVVASRATRQAQRETERITAARMRTERRLQQHLQDEIYRSEHSRVSQVGGRGVFSRITFAQRVRDRWRAIAGALTRQQSFYDVVESYRRELEDEAKLAAQGASPKGLRRLVERGWADSSDVADGGDGIDRRDDGARIRPSDRLRARIGELQGEACRLEEQEEGDDAAGVEFVKLLEQQEKDDEPLYNTWYTYLGRPAYFEQVNDRLREEAEQAASKNSENTEESKHAVDRALSRVERLTKWLKGVTDLVAQNAVIISIPIEAGFTLPSFLVLTPDKPYAAVLGRSPAQPGREAAQPLPGRRPRSKANHDYQSYTGAWEILAHPSDIALRRRPRRKRRSSRQNP